jgi:hypothetical protein
VKGISQILILFHPLPALHSDSQSIRGFTSRVLQKLVPFKPRLRLDHQPKETRLLKWNAVCPLRSAVRLIVGDFILIPCIDVERSQALIYEHHFAIFSRLFAKNHEVAMFDTARVLPLRDYFVHESMHVGIGSVTELGFHLFGKLARSTKIFLRARALECMEALGLRTCSYSLAALP